MTWLTLFGVTYYILVQDGDNFDPEFALTITSHSNLDDNGTVLPKPPVNDDCTNAIPLLLVDGTVSELGTTIRAFLENIYYYCGAAVGYHERKGVWYTVTGDRTKFMASTCGTATFNTEIAIYSSCGYTTTCIVANKDADWCGGTSRVFWDTVSNKMYYIIVHGVYGHPGNFTLLVSSSAFGQLLHIQAYHSTGI